MLSHSLFVRKILEAQIRSTQKTSSAAAKSFRSFHMPRDLVRTLYAAHGTNNAVHCSCISLSFNAIRIFHFFECRIWGSQAPCAQNISKRQTFNSLQRNKMLKNISFNYCYPRMNEWMTQRGKNVISNVCHALNKYDRAFFRRSTRIRCGPLAQRNALNTKLNHNYKMAKVIEIRLRSLVGIVTANLISLSGFSMAQNVNGMFMGTSFARFGTEHAHNRKRLKQLFARDINIRRQVPNDILNAGLYSTRQPGHGIT